MDSFLYFLLANCFPYLSSFSYLPIFSYQNTKGPSIKYVRKIFRKTNISNPLIRTHSPKNRYQSFLVVSNFTEFLYVVPNVLSGITERLLPKDFQKSFSALVSRDLIQRYLKKIQNDSGDLCKVTNL